MSIRSKIQDWLGITSIKEALTIQYEGQIRANTTIFTELSCIRTQVGAVTPGLGRVIAKLDPMYGKPELDPIRKAESDRLGDQVIEKLKTEHLARQHTEGKVTNDPTLHELYDVWKEPHR